MAPERLDLFERDLGSHAKTLTELTLSLRELHERTGKLEQWQAVQAVEDRMQRQLLDEKMAGIMQRIDAGNQRVDAVYRLGWWLFTAFGASTIGMIVLFAFKGGFVVK